MKINKNLYSFVRLTYLADELPLYGRNIMEIFGFGITLMSLVLFWQTLKMDDR